MEDSLQLAGGEVVTCYATEHQYNSLPEAESCQRGFAVPNLVTPDHQGLASHMKKG